MQTRVNLNRSIKIAMVALSWLFVMSGGFVQAQMRERPKPGPELKKLRLWVGEWKYEGTLKDTPMGPGGKFVGKQTARMILDDLFLEITAEDKGTYGGKEITFKGVTIQWFDTAKQVYLDQSFDNDGFASSGVTTVDGNTWAGTETRIDRKGKVYKAKYLNMLSADGKTCISKTDLSEDDGKTWLPWWELTMKKVRD